MNIEKQLAEATVEAVQAEFDTNVEPDDVQVQLTRKEFEGDYTVVAFPFVRFARRSPEKTAEAIGEYITGKFGWIDRFNVVKGFLNIVLSDSHWMERFSEIQTDEEFGNQPTGSKPLVLVEYSSPNTNKPLHLGHLRNIFLGYSVSEILKAHGHDVKKVQIINDRGIHICKSMVAWKKFGQGETPESSGLKGDHLVGKYYVEFDKVYKREISDLKAEGYSEEEAAQQSAIMTEAREMLVKWEARDEETMELWRTMNQWVYDGFAQTYQRMGVDFDKLYYESDTYLLGRDEVGKGVEQGIFKKKEDGSVWADLSKEGLDDKLLLRKDGTAVYMTQDIGTAVLRFRDFPSLSKQIYTVGNEQEYHFKVLFILLEKLGYEWASNCFHLSYGMVELPEGKMKSREGTVVDADDLMEEMEKTAADITEELGKLEGLPQDEKQVLHHHIGMAALKYFILRVDPKKQMLFDPAESIDFNGNTGPFIQYTHARIQSVLRNHEGVIPSVEDLNEMAGADEREMVKMLSQYPDAIGEAARTYNPSVLANYIYDLVKSFNSFYQKNPILRADTDELKNFRLALTAEVGKVVKKGMKLLGIDVPDRM